MDMLSICAPGPRANRKLSKSTFAKVPLEPDPRVPVTVLMPSSSVRVTGLNPPGKSPEADSSYARGAAMLDTEKASRLATRNPRQHMSAVHDRRRFIAVRFDSGPCRILCCWNRGDRQQLSTSCETLLLIAGTRISLWCSTSSQSVS